MLEHVALSIEVLRVSPLIGLAGNGLARVQIVFFTASRGHHADVGGITPGSMPPTSRRLVEEGAAIISFKLVKNGKFQVSFTQAWSHSGACENRRPNSWTRP